MVARNYTSTFKLKNPLHNADNTVNLNKRYKTYNWNYKYAAVII